MKKDATDPTEDEKRLSLRVSKRIWKALNLEALEREISVNALVNLILADRYPPK